MTDLLLQDALVERVRSVLAGYTLPTRGGEPKGVQVFRQFLPLPMATQGGPEESRVVFSDSMAYGDEDFARNFPCVVVKIDEGTDREDGGADACLVRVRLLIGVFDDGADCQGYRDALNIAGTVRLDLQTNRYLDMKYRLEMPLRWYVFDEQPWPVFFACIETEWAAPRPMEQVPGANGRSWRDGEYAK